MNRRKQSQSGHLFRIPDSDVTIPQFTRHAKEQIGERYGVDLTDVEWMRFGQTLNDPNLTIRLSNDKQACYFMGHWHLLLCAQDGTVITAYPRLAVTDEDKLILIRDKRYRRICHDEFRVGLSSHVDSETLPKEKTIKLSDTEYLSSDFRKTAENLLKKICDTK